MRITGARESPPITLIKSKKIEKQDTDRVNNKLRRYLTSDNLTLYEFKVALFDNVNPEGFLLFIRNFQMNLEAP